MVTYLLSINKIHDTNKMVKINSFSGDVTTLRVDCIVVSTNSNGLGCFNPEHPCIEQEIHKAAGPTLLEECRTLGRIKPGTAKITHGHNLLAKYIIHVTGPKKVDTKEDLILLKICYINILDLVKEYSIRSLGFLSLFPVEKTFDHGISINLGISTVKTWIMEQKPIWLKSITFLVYPKEDHEIYKNLLKKYFAT